MATSVRERPSAQELARQAKEPIAVVAGPYGHPFHPILVTVPIGAWIGSLVLDIGSRVVDDPAGLSRASYWLIGLGILGALAAAIFGLLDLLVIPRRTPAFRTGLTHMTINLVVVALFTTAFVIRMDRASELEVSSGLVALSAVALGLLGIAGWLGGRLSYRFGVRVAGEDTQVDGFR